jgi:hypothetical protein
VPDAFHNTEQYANNRVECDHGRLKARLRPMRGLKTDRTGGRRGESSRRPSTLCGRIGVRTVSLDPAWEATDERPDP